MKNIILLIVLVTNISECVAQEKVIDTTNKNGLIISSRLSPKASKLLLFDSLILQKDILGYNQLVKFVEQNKHKSYSFVADFNLILYQNKLSLKFSEIRNDFDSIILGFVYSKFLNYNVISKKKKDRQVYRLSLVVVFSNDENAINIELSEMHSLKFYSKTFYFKDFLVCNTSGL